MVSQTLGHLSASAVSGQIHPYLGLSFCEGGKLSSNDLCYWLNIMCVCVFLPVFSPLFPDTRIYHKVRGEKLMICEVSVSSLKEPRVRRDCRIRVVGARLWAAWRVCEQLPGKASSLAHLPHCPSPLASVGHVSLLPLAFSLLFLAFSESLALPFRTGCNQHQIMIAS